jgi:hypothetical protein
VISPESRQTGLPLPLSIYLSGFAPYRSTVPIYPFGQISPAPSGLASVNSVTASKWLPPGTWG